jgi:natural product biosynthesis luciferase-like monooxygenase protein
MDFSLFYFAADGDADGGRYRLLLDGARFADTHGFAAVWTPERHFHRFGGLFPNPSVTAAAVAAITTRVGVRAGSVVVPLHHPLRIAEEWSVVDNLSHGRAGVSLASGWNRDDFLFNPDGYAERRESTVAVIDTLRALWRGEPYDDRHLFPRPVQEQIPLWLTSGGSLDTFRAAGRAGVGVLTNLLTYSLEDLPEKVAAYRAEYAGSGLPGRGHVTLMMHTYLAADLAEADRQVRQPLQRYLLHSLDLNVRARLPGVTMPIRDAWSPVVVRRAYERYLNSDGLFGSVADGLRTVDRVRAADVDEVACLIDFGIPVDVTLAGLERLDDLRRAAAPGADRLASPEGAAMSAPSSSSSET